MKISRVILITVLSSASVMVLGVSSFISYFVYETEYKITDISSSISPDGDYSLLFQNIGEADFPFGHNHVQLVLEKDSSTISSIKFDVANDGKNLGEKNWTVEWKSNCVEATIYGEEQYDALYVLGFDGNISSSTLDTIYGSIIN